MNLGGTIRLNPLGLCIIFGAFILFMFYVMSGSYNNNNESDKKHDSMVNLKSLLVAAVEVAMKGGSAVKATRLEANLQVKSKGETKEGVDDPVTNADFKSHCIMYNSLVNTFPKIKVISEEHPESSCPNAIGYSVDAVGVVGSATLPDQMVPAEDVTIWIDPLDATKEFTENLLQYVTTMVCVAVKGVPVIGVVHSPFGTEAKTSWAWVGKETSPDVAAGPKSNRHSNSGVTVIVSRSHAGKVKNISEQAFGTDSHIIAAAGAGYKVLEVINGPPDVYLHVTAIKKWDVCAGDALLLSVGGSLTDLLGHKLDYSSGANPLNENGIVATLTDPQSFIQKLAKFNPLGKP